MEEIEGIQSLKVSSKVEDFRNHTGVFLNFFLNYEDDLSFALPSWVI